MDVASSVFDLHHRRPWVDALAMAFSDGRDAQYVRATIRSGELGVLGAWSGCQRCHSCVLCYGACVLLAPPRTCPDDRTCLALLPSWTSTTAGRGVDALVMAEEEQVEEEPEAEAELTMPRSSSLRFSNSSVFTLL